MDDNQEMTEMLKWSKKDLKVVIITFKEVTANTLEINRKFQQRSRRYEAKPNENFKTEKYKNQDKKKSSLDRLNSRLNMTKIQ